MSHPFTFTSGGVVMDAWHFRAEHDGLAGDAGRPAVVMAHGFAGTKDSGLRSFAENLAATGLDVLAFDFRGFGASEGTPRQVISPRKQIEDYRAALDAAAALPEVDPGRLVLWGVSMSSGTVLSVAAGRTDIAAVIALTPLVSAIATDPAGPAADRRRVAPTARLLARAARDEFAAATGRARVMSPAVGRPDEAALLNFPGTYEDYLSIAGPTWRNEVNSSIAFDALLHRPHRDASRMRCPALFQIADFDRCVPTGAAMRAARRARAQVRHYPCDHFDVYPGKRWHDAVTDHQALFLGQVLTPRPR
ncbi:alpha/beta hydrolase [Nocardia takedensis]